MIIVTFYTFSSMYVCVYIYIEHNKITTYKLHITLYCPKYTFSNNPYHYKTKFVWKEEMTIAWINIVNFAPKWMNGPIRNLIKFDFF